MVYSCSVAARDDRILYKAFKESKQLSLLKFAALRPFYEKARLLTSDDNKADVEQLMGELMNDDDEGVENRGGGIFDFKKNLVKRCILEVQKNSDIRELFETYFIFLQI